MGEGHVTQHGGEQRLSELSLEVIHRRHGPGVAVLGVARRTLFPRRPVGEPGPQLREHGSDGGRLRGRVDRRQQFRQHRRTGQIDRGGALHGRDEAGPGEAAAVQGELPGDGVVERL